MKQDTFNTVTDVLKLKSIVCNDPTSNWQAPQEPAIYQDHYKYRLALCWTVHWLQPRQVSSQVEVELVQ